MTLWVVIVSLSILLPGCFMLGYRYRELVHVRIHGNSISEAQSILNKEVRK